MADEFIKLDTTIIAIDNLINEAATGTIARTLFKVKDTIYNQQRYVIDVQPVVETEDLATATEQFICKNCGIYLKDYIKVVLDEDNDEYIDELHYEHEPKFCPECGAKVKDGDTNG